MGCMDEEALNYDSDAIIDDESCQYFVPKPEPVIEEEELEIATMPDEILGCAIPHACNYDANANKNDGSCEYESCLTITEDISELIEGDVVELKIYWDLDKYFVREKDMVEIKSFAKYLITNPELNVLLTVSYTHLTLPTILLV